MSPIILVWVLSLLVLVAIAAYALHRVRYEREAGDLSTLIAYTAVDTYRIAKRGVRAVEPHARRVAVLCIERGRGGYELMFDRMFGRGEIERGRTASFFLKNIAEHKDATRKERIDEAERLS